MCFEETIISFANGHCPDLQNVQSQMLSSSDVLPLRPMLVRLPLAALTFTLLTVDLRSNDRGLAINS